MCTSTFSLLGYAESHRLGIFGLDIKVLDDIEIASKPIFWHYEIVG